MQMLAIIIGMVCSGIYFDCILNNVNQIKEDQAPLRLSAGGWGILAALFPIIFIPLYFIMRRRLVEAPKYEEQPTIDEANTVNRSSDTFTNSQVMKGIFIALLSSIVIMGLTGNLNDDFEQFTSYEAVLPGGVVCASYNEAVLFYTIEKKLQDILPQFLPPDCIMLEPQYEIVIETYSSTPHSQIIQIVDINGEVSFTDIKFTNIKKRSDSRKN